MKLESVLRQLDIERRSLVYEGAQIEILPRVSRFWSNDHSCHSVVSSSLTSDTADEEIEQEIGHHRSINASFEWKLYSHDTPTDMLSRLQQHGFTIGPREAVLVYDLSSPAPWIADRSIRVDRVDRLDQLPDYRSVAAEVFEKDYSFTTGELAEAIRGGSTQHRAYVAFDHDKPVSVGRLYTHPQSHFAGLYGGGTLAAHRGKGFYRATIAARARDAIELGTRYLQVDALPTSRPVLERLGFLWLTDTYPCEWKPPK